MKIEHQETFKALAPAETGVESLVVHQRGDDDRCLVVLIHGWNGDRYGTWQLLPRFLFEDLDECAVGLYGYSSGFKRVWSDQFRVTVEQHAKELADTLRDCPYGRIVLVGHSMGGLLAKAVVARLIQTGSHRDGFGPTIGRMSGLVLLATPQAGAKGFLGRYGFAADKAALRLHGRFVADLAEVFTNHVRIGLDEAATDKAWLPTFAGTTTKDRWVTGLSAHFGIPSNQSKTVRGTHTTFVKPASRGSGLYPWLRDQIQFCLSTERPKPVTPAATPPPCASLRHQPSRVRLSTSDATETPRSSVARTC